MARRIIDSDVKDVYGEIPDGTNLNPFIISASQITDKVAASDTDSTLNSATLKAIEQWLAAHFYAASNPGVQNESNLGASATYQGQTGMFLESTYWGQNAILMDTTGYLARMQDVAKNGGIQTAGVLWLGKTKSTQIPYDQRD